VIFLKKLVMFLKNIAHAIAVELLARDVLKRKEARFLTSLSLSVTTVP